MILKDNGKLYFKTDHKKYYEDVLELVQNELENYRVYIKLTSILAQLS